VIDIQAFQIERERLRRFCFARTKAVIVIHDVAAAGSSSFRDPRNDDPVSRLAEFIQLLLLVDATRFADPDDVCADFGPSLIAFPTIDARQDVATVLAASDNTFEAIIVDYRVTEAVLPVLAPHLVLNKSNLFRTWDRELRKQRRIAAILTVDPGTDDVAIYCDGGRLLRRSSGEMFDLAGQFWLQVYNEISSQHCMRRETWRQKDFQTEGNA
jgi:hypothetical protein